MTLYQHEGFFDFHLVRLWAMSFPWTLNHLIDDWTSLLSSLSLLLFSGLAYVRNFMMPQLLSHHFTHFWSFHPWSINETLPWRAWLGLRIPTVDSLPPTQIKHQTPRLLHYVILVFLTLLPGPLRHLWQLTVQLPTLELRPILIHIQASHLLMSLFRRSKVLHTTTSIVLTSLPAWFTRSNSRSLPTPTIPGSYSLKRSPCQGFPNVVILSTTFTVFRATGSGHCAQRIIGDIILRFL